MCLVGGQCTCLAVQKQRDEKRSGAEAKKKRIKTRGETRSEVGGSSRHVDEKRETINEMKVDSFVVMVNDGQIPV